MRLILRVLSSVGLLPFPTHPLPEGGSAVLVCFSDGYGEDTHLYTLHAAFAGRG